jgi:hypothetical protein
MRPKRTCGFCYYQFCKKPIKADEEEMSKYEEEEDRTDTTISSFETWSLDLGVCNAEGKSQNAGK